MLEEAPVSFFGDEHDEAYVACSTRRPPSFLPALSYKPFAMS
jgi:hypothetical protein